MEKTAVLRKLRRLGHGGYAETWLAEVLDHDLATEWNTRQVAVKIPFPEYARQFKKEIQLSGALLLQLTEAETRNIVRYLGFEILDEINVMVMEFVPGGSLRDRIGLFPHGKSLPLADALAMALGTLNGLAVLHAKNIFHRDIKPENILLDGDIPKISDLGVARMAITQELSSTQTGTPYYAAPEIVKCQGADFRADLWSFGMTFFEMLYGRLPFALNEAGSTLAVARLLADGEGPPVFPAEPAIPARLQEIIGRCLARDPAGRFPNAGELANALREFARPADAIVTEAVRKMAPHLKNPNNRAKLLPLLQELVRKYPFSPASHYHLGQFLNQSGEPEAALASFQRGLGVTPEDAHLNWGFGVGRHRLGDFRAAALALEKALAGGLEPDLAKGARLLLAGMKTAAARTRP